jgi:hypothetical protein
MTKEDFKNFVRNKPELASYVTNGDMSWQKFYELYDIYGEDESIWNKYTNKPSTKITDVLSKFNPDSFQNHLETAQKALDIFSEFANKGAENITNNIKPNIERPLSKFFGD